VSLCADVLRKLVVFAEAKRLFIAGLLGDVLQDALGKRAADALPPAAVHHRAGNFFLSVMRLTPSSM
jgi:hypothetical protein